MLVLPRPLGRAVRQSMQACLPVLRIPLAPNSAVAHRPHQTDSVRSGCVSLPSTRVFDQPHTARIGRDSHAPLALIPRRPRRDVPVLADSVRGPVVVRSDPTQRPRNSPPWIRCIGDTHLGRWVLFEPRVRVRGPMVRPYRLRWAPPRVGCFARWGSALLK